MQTSNTLSKQIWDQVSQVHIFLYFRNKYILFQNNNKCNRDTDFAKLIQDAFKQLEKKHSKRISVNVLNAQLSEEHLLPTMIVQDRSSGEIVTQIFNFTDHFPQKQQVNLESVEKLLRLKGILEPQGGTQMKFDSKKDEAEYILAVGSNYLQNQLDERNLEDLNQFLHETENVQEFQIDARTVNYKECLLESYKMVQDPFKIEIEDINFDQNPNDPSQLQMNIKFKNEKYQKIQTQE